MKVVFRTDASKLIGTGHVMRCLTLAERLEERGCRIEFICRDIDASARQLLTGRNHGLHLLPFDADDRDKAAVKSGYDAWLGVDWSRDADETVEVLTKTGGSEILVVDHYGIDARWESRIRQHVRVIVVIDDLANRPHNCDILLDHNLGHDDARYASYAPEDCTILTGSQFALLRPEFAELRPQVKVRSEGVENILVSFGGVDATNETSKTLRALDSAAYKDIAIQVVLGAANTHRQEIIRLAGRMGNVTIRENVTCMSKLMLSADLCLGAAGTTSWERCCLGLPTIMVAVADNQESIARAIDNAGAGVYIGTTGTVTEGDIAAKVDKLIHDRNRLASMSRRAAGIVDGDGAKRVADCLMSIQAPEGASV